MSAHVSLVIDCESCTCLISAHPASKEAGELRTKCGMFGGAHHLEVVAVTGLLLFRWCELSAE